MKNILGLIAFASVLLTSCSNDDDNGTLVIEEKTNLTEENLELDFGDDILLESPNNQLRQWYLGDSLILEAISYNFRAQEAGNYVVSAVKKENNITDSLVYNIRVFGQFAEGVILVNSTNDAMENGALTFIAPDNTVILNVFENTNNLKLSDGLISANTHNNSVFLVSQKGPDYITEIDRETLLFKNKISSSDASSPSYLNFYKDKGVLVNANNNDRAFYFWNLNDNHIYSPNLQALDNVPAIQAAALEVGEDLLLVNENSVFKYNQVDKEAVEFYTADGFVSGVLPDSHGGFYIATQQTADNPAQFIHYNAQLAYVETIMLPDNYKLPRNGNINASTDSFYWQETSTGSLIKYDFKNQSFTDLGSGYLYGIMFTTIIKENPFTKEIYIGGWSDFYTSKGMVVKLSPEGELLASYEDIGYSPVDFIFNSKEMFK